MNEMHRNNVINVAVPITTHLFLSQIIEFNDESSEDEDYNIVLAHCLKKGDKPPRVTGYLEHVLNNLSAHEFQMHFRIPIEAFQYLVEELSPRLRSKGSGPCCVPVDKQILVTIWLLATPDSYRSVGDRFDISKSTLSQCFIRVIKALCELAANKIKWPERNTLELLQRKILISSRIPNALGAIDGCYIPIKAPKENAECYINRKCFHAITLQAICDPFLQFIDCFVGYPSSVSDIRIFRNSHIYEDINNRPDFFPNGEYILGDKAYPSLHWLLVPYINRGNLTETQIYFNTQHTKGRQIIERAFALLKGGFRRLKYVDMNRTDLIPATVLAACVLLNICIQFKDSFLETYIQDALQIEDNLLDRDDFRVHEINQNGTLMRDRIAAELWNNR